MGKVEISVFTTICGVKNIFSVFSSLVAEKFYLVPTEV
jgi:hypothetical protein